MCYEKHFCCSTENKSVEMINMPGDVMIMYDVEGLITIIYSIFVMESIV